MLKNKEKLESIKGNLESSHQVLVFGLVHCFVCMFVKLYGHYFKKTRTSFEQ